MTNEELALLIQAGHTEHYGELWERCRKLLFYILARYQKRLELPNYISGEDLEQCMYAALREAVKAYDSGKGYQFTTYLHFHVMRAVRAQLPDSRIKEISGNESVKDDDSEGAALFDFIADDTAAVSFQSIEQREMRLIVRRAVAMLPNDSRICICLNFFENITQKQIAVITGYSESKVHAAIMRGLHTLYKNKALRALYY